MGERRYSQSDDNLEWLAIYSAIRVYRLGRIGEMGSKKRIAAFYTFISYKLPIRLNLLEQKNEIENKNR